MQDWRRDQRVRGWRRSHPRTRTRTVSTPDYHSYYKNNGKTGEDVFQYRKPENQYIFTILEININASLTAVASIKACAAACFPTYSLLKFVCSANGRAAMPEKRIIVKFRIYATFGVLREIVWSVKSKF